MLLCHFMKYFYIYYHIIHSHIILVRESIFRKKNSEFREVKWYVYIYTASKGLEFISFSLFIFHCFHRYLLPSQCKNALLMIKTHIINFKFNSFGYKYDRYLKILGFFLSKYGRYLILGQQHKNFSKWINYILWQMKNHLSR